MANQKDTIKNAGEECDCRFCSFPLYVGDVVWVDGDTDLPYCSEACIASDKAYQIRRQNERARKTGAA